MEILRVTSHPSTKNYKNCWYIVDPELKYDGYLYVKDGVSNYFLDRKGNKI